MPKKEKPPPRDILAKLRPGPKKPSAVPRAVIMGLDNIERGISLFAGAIAMVLAAVVSPHILHNTTVIDTIPLSKTKKCTAAALKLGYHLYNEVCQKNRLTHPSAWWPQFLEILIIGLAIIGFALLRKRVGVIVSGLLLGLALGTVGLPFLFVGGWLIIRAFRLQRYGDPTFSGSGRAARELNQEKRAAKREGRAVAPLTQKAPAPPPTPPSESKRYTPKKPVRKKK